MKQRNDAMLTTAECERSGQWPGYANTGFTRLPEYLFGGDDDIQTQDEEE